MRPGTYNLDLYRGDTFTWRLTLKNEDGSPFDITGVTAKAEVRDKPAGALITELAATVTPPNIIDLVLDADNWAEMPAKGVWDCQLTYPDGTVWTVLAGTTSVTPDVTDSAASPAAVLMRAAVR